MNPNTTSPSFSTCLTLLVFLLLTACAHAGAPIQGQVLEQGTDKPIPGAIVVVRWQGDQSALVESHRICLHVETATTDNQGRFHTPLWVMGPSAGFINDVESSITAYKPGYTFGTVPSEKDTVWLKPFTGSREEQLRKTAGAAITCPGAGASQKDLLPLYHRVYEDARPLAVTKDDKAIVSGILFKIEMIELPFAEADKRNTDRLNAIDHEK